jgi:hypothetical protein
VTDEPAGRSNSTTQEVLAVSPVLRMTYWPPYPVLHTEVWLNVAVSSAPAACAGVAKPTAIVAAARTTRRRDIGPPGVIGSRR